MFPPPTLAHSRVGLLLRQGTGACALKKLVLRFGLWWGLYLLLGSGPTDNGRGAQYVMSERRGRANSFDGSGVG